MRRIIIDTDTAGDDTIAILTALHHFKVEGVTITGGNVDFDQEVENALYTIQVFNPDYHVPVFKGYEGPILGTQEGHVTVEDVHGKDGMGDSFFEKAKQRPEDKHAIDFIIETVKANPGEIELLAIAPLTNIAMAMKKDPTIVKDIPHIYIMGGTNNSLGNITAAAEYNFYVDPEAAKIVLHSGIPITMVGWDMCTRYSVMADEDHQEIEKLGTERSKFFMDINRVVLKFNREVHKINGTTHPDTLLVAIAANEELMTKSTMYYVDVETKGEITRGYNMVDINNRSGKNPNVRVCEAVDRDVFKADLLAVLRGK
ncbi:nucleoside hydrolase [Ornithinibacillus bavariensis]|uniref:Nucleoside hydrolase n=1 Tax=Ornithinibacillus bavariensis TaxID=545502 RepID=A0A919XA58_9BACI|nr:nucleoside hydrolase [Ornithinibacillus bavariensis]GIO27330.1 nucleoside hydrolase [Ornithinibacillus bavariensis]HAM81937.1 ribosylpyrimidine nucleosidase [Ornithinibacillus sp.]